MQNSVEPSWQVTFLPQKNNEMEKPHEGIGVKLTFEAKCFHN
jgi:hypothetical protein